MKKTLGLLALTVSLGAVGCAMLPHASKAPATTAPQVGYSGFGKAVLENLNGAGYSTQAVGNGAKLVVARAYKADPTDGINFKVLNSAVASDSVTGNYLVATASVTTTGAATLTLPKLPVGNYVIKLDAYNTTVPGHNGDWSDGATTSYAVVAQSAAHVQAQVGLPYTATFAIYSTFKQMFNIDASASTNATPSIAISGLLPGTNGLFLRMAHWNPFASLEASQTVRVTIVSPTAFPLTLASGSTAAHWFLGDSTSAKGFQATQSFPAWSWDSTRKYLYTDIDLSNSAYTTDFATDSYSVKTLGSLSFRLPAAFVPAGYSLSITDISSGSSTAGSTTL